jgi:hypothetical protein
MVAAINDLSPAYPCHWVTGAFLSPAMAYLQNKVIREAPVLSLFSAIALQPKESAMTALTDNINEIIRLTTDEKAVVEKAFVSMEISKGDLWVKRGRICDQVAFVVSDSQYRGASFECPL